MRLALLLLAAAFAQAPPTTTTGAAASAPVAAAPAEREIAAILATIDASQANAGDTKARVFIDRQTRTGPGLAYEAIVYRRDHDDKLALQFVKPAVEAGKAYLRADTNLFLYDPVARRWERRTDRERIGGTDGLRGDFGASHLADEYTAAWVGEERLGRFAAWHLALTARAGASVAWPTVELWVDKETKTLLKRRDVAESGRPVRTTWYPEWRVVKAPDGTDVAFPREIRIKDEVEVGNLTTIVLDEVDLRPLPDSVFTKAWLEVGPR